MSALGILGGGQLAQMLCDAARTLAIPTRVLSPDPEAPARDHCDDFIQSGFDDPAALQRLAAASSVVTLDNEHIPLDTLRQLDGQTAVMPGTDIMTAIRDRLAQRGLLMRLNLPQTRYWPVDKPAAVRAAQCAAVFPAVLKTRHGGYDGYGQVRIDNAQDLPAAWERLERRACVLESWITDVREFSLVGARGADGTIRLYQPIGNDHSGGQLQISHGPLPLPDGIAEQARHAWTTLAEDMGLRGVMAVEFFLDAEDTLLVNEIAPRVHNSGHLTQQAYACSQFELHVRAVMGLPLPELGPGRPTVMLNLYPEHGILSDQDARRARDAIGGDIYWYGKAPRPRRKLGHWLLSPDRAQAARAVIHKSAR